jgi:hypothetical protein
VEVTRDGCLSTARHCQRQKLAAGPQDGRSAPEAATVGRLLLEGISTVQRAL